MRYLLSLMRHRFHIDEFSNKTDLTNLKDHISKTVPIGYMGYLNIGVCRLAKHKEPENSR